MSLEEKVKWGDVWREYENPLDFLREYYAGVTRGDLQKIDSGLYQRLLRDCLLEHVPRKNRSLVTILLHIIMNIILA